MTKSVKLLSDDVHDLEAEIDQEIFNLLTGEVKMSNHAEEDRENLKICFPNADGAGSAEFIPEDPKDYRDADVMAGHRLSDFKILNPTIDTQSFEVHDLTCEESRRYLYEDGMIVIDEPKTLYIGASGSHRVLGLDGWVTYLVPGWRAIRWLPTDPDVPVAF